MPPKASHSKGHILPRLSKLTLGSSGNFGSVLTGIRYGATNNQVAADVRRLGEWELLGFEHTPYCDGGDG
jgi:hypothetical protein